MIQRVMTKTPRVGSDADVLELERLITASAIASVANLKTMAERGDALRTLAAVKFDAIGCDPLSDRPLNLIEQVNQTFTYLATCAAVRQLLELHANAAPFILNLGTTPGPDIISCDGSVAAEVFAATHPASNDKLRKDLAKAAAFSAKYKYVFFSWPNEPAGPRLSIESYDSVHVVSLGLCHGDS